MAASLQIARGGRAVYDEPVESNFCSGACVPSLHPTLRFLRLGRHGQRDLVLGLTSAQFGSMGPAPICCVVLQVFSFDTATGTYLKTGHNFGITVPQIADLRHNGRLEFVTVDDSFLGHFGNDQGISYYASLPIQILTFSGRRFKNVTRAYPGAIAGDAAGWLSQYTSFGAQGGLADQAIAAWAADEDILGQEQSVASYLQQQVQQGHLTVGFVAGLQKFLRRHGYAR